MTKTSKLHNDISDLIEKSGCKKKDVLEAVTESLIYSVLGLSIDQPIHAEERHRALSVLSYWFETHREDDVSKNWHRNKLKRLLS